MSEAPDLIRLASEPALADDFIQAINAAGLTGKKRALLQLLVHINEHDLPASHSNLRGRSTRALIDDSEFNPGSSPRDEHCEQADLQVAVARSLAFDQELDSWSISGREQRRFHWTAGDAWMFNLTDHSGRTRSSWSELDESLLQSAIELWQPGGKLSTARSEPFTDTVRLMVAVGRYVHHAQAIQAFSRAGIDLNDFAEWVVDPKNPDTVEHDRIWIKEISKKQPIPVAMTDHGNLLGAAALMSAWTSPESKNVARQLADAVASTDGTSGVPAQLMKIVQNDRPHNSDQTTARDEALQFLNVIDAIHPSPGATTGKILLLKRVIDLNGRRGEPRDTVFAQSVLGSPAGFASTNVRGVLARTDLAEQVPALSHATEELGLSCIKMNHHELIKGSEALLSMLASASPTDRTLIVRAAGDVGAEMLLQPEDFAQTLQVLQGAGIDLWSPVDQHPGLMTPGGRQKTTSLLHELAASRTPHYASALAVALDMGADPDIKDHAGRRPANLIDEPGRRDHWRSIVRSHAAKAVALEALDEIMPPGAKP